MPVHDHFHGTLRETAGWEEFHTVWTANLVRKLNRTWLAPQYRATVERYFGAGLKVDVGVVREPQATYAAGIEPGEERRYEPPAADATIPGLTVPHVRTLIRDAAGRLVGAVELVSPANKDRPEARDGFAARIQTYLQSGISLVVVDLVADYRTNLHNRWAELFGPSRAPQFESAGHPLYAVAYRPHADGQPLTEQVDLWLRPVAVGDELPTMPLFLEGPVVVPIELEETYRDTCLDLRLPEPQTV